MGQMADVQQLVAALATELATHVGDQLDAPVEIAESTDAAEIRWVVRLAVDGALTGSLDVVLDAKGARRLASLASSPESNDNSNDDSADESLAEPLTECWRRILADLSGRPGLEHLVVTIEACEAAETTPTSEPVSWFVMTMGEASMAVGFRADVQAGQRGEAAAVAAPGPAVPSNLDLVLDIDLPLSVRFGHTDMTLATLSRIGPGSVIELDRAPEDPVDILVNGKLVARGEVVVVTGNYGVRITEVMSAAERIRSLGA